MLIKYSRAIIAIFVVVFAFVCAPVKVWASENSLATLIGVQGRVDIKRTGDTRFVTASSQGLLYEGDIVRAEKNGFASILFSDGSQVKLKADATIEIQHGATPDKSQSFFKALIGVIWAHMTPNSMIETPTCNIIVRGTDIIVEIAPDGTVRLVVLSGTAEIVTANGTTVVTTDQQITVSPGGGTTGIQPADTTGMDDWTYQEVVVPDEPVTEQVDPYTGTFNALAPDATPADFTIPVSGGFTFTLPDIFIPAVPISTLVAASQFSNDSNAPAPEGSSLWYWVVGGLIVVLQFAILRRKLLKQQ